MATIIVVNNDNGSNDNNIDNTNKKGMTIYLMITIKTNRARI